VAVKSHKPIVWGLFAVGGTLSAFLLPAIIIVTLLAAFEVVNLSYGRVQAFAENWIGKLILFGVIGLTLWHAAHRLRSTAHDFGIRADALMSYLLYGVAGLGTLATAYALLSI
jgi:fumarate reductase subunit D